MKIRIAATALLIGSGLVAACGGGEDAGVSAESPPSETPMPDAGNAENEAQDEAAMTPEPSADMAEEPDVQLAGLPAPYATADYAKGKRVFLQCSSCHSIAEGGPTLLGPNIHGLFSRKVGGLEGFGYSKALQEADFQWTPDQLDQWLANPRSFLPGNRMSFAGVPREDNRQAVIAYIMAEAGYDAAN